MLIGPDGKCPEEAFTGCKVSVSHVKTFGCIAYADIPKETRGKLELVARKTILVGYMPTSRQYRLYDPVTREVIVSSAPIFAEDEFWEWPDEPEEPGVDIESLEPLESIDLDVSELLGIHVERPAEPESGEPRQGSEEPQAEEGPQEAVEDVVRPQDEAGDDLRPQGAMEDDDTDENTIVVNTGSSVDARNDPQEGSAT